MKKGFLIIYLMSLATQGITRDYFVSPGGFDANDGSMGNPLKTIQVALNLCVPGDTVQLRTGTYFEKLNWKNTGSFNLFITLKNYNGEQAIIDGTGKTGISLLHFWNVNYTAVKGIIFQNNYIQEAAGITVDTAANNLSISFCTIRNIGWTNNPNADPESVNPVGSAHAILVDGRTIAGIDSVKITGCKIYDIITGNSEALTLVGNVNVFELSDDTVYNTKNIGIVAAGHYSWSVNPGVPDSLNLARNGIITRCVVYDNRRFSNVNAPAGIYVDGGSNIKIISNRSYKNGNGISVGCETPGFVTRGITLMNNLVYNNDNLGLIFGSNALGSIIKNCLVINNTFFENGSLQANPSEISLQNGDSCIIANNILLPGGDYHYGISIFPGFVVSHLTVDHNLAYRYSGFYTDLFITGYTGQLNQYSPVNTTNAEPFFINNNLTSLNLYISNNSNAINAGTAAYPLPSSVDAGSGYRVVNGAIDIGAFERQDGGCPAVFTIGDAQLLKGKFAASQQLIFERSQLSVIQDSMRWSSPLITVKSSFQSTAAITVDTSGCN